MKETELAEKVVKWLSAQEWDVYQEVAACGSVADIVATQDRLLWVIECKLTLSLELIGQAFEWRRRAHFVTVAVPRCNHRYSKGRQVARIILKSNGIGLLEIGPHEINRHTEQPGLNRKAYVNDIRKRLCENQKHWAPAGSQSGYWTPFQETARKVAAEVRMNPGIILKDLVDIIKHHYTSDITARACISKWTQNGVIKGVRCEKDGRYLKFFPDA